MALKPGLPEAVTGLVNLDLDRKQPADALRLVQQQLAITPEDSKLYFVLGQVELRNQDPGKAEEALQKATDLDKNNVLAFLMLANLQASRGSAQDAIGGYQRALQANPRDVRLYVALASLLETQGQWQQAETYYQQALQVQPDYPLAANNLAYLMLDHGGNVNVALSLAQTARRGLPDLPNSADTLGWAYFNENAFGSAIDLLQQAIKGDPKNATFHYHLGMTYEKANNHAMAKQQFEDTLQINPNFAQAGEIRRMLSE
jgi:tetratricopeptide (TPR) repeat protein